MTTTLGHYVTDNPVDAQVKVPAGFRALLASLAREVLRAQPADIYAFSALYFEKFQELRKKNGGLTPLTNAELYKEFKTLLSTEASNQHLLSKNALLLSPTYAASSGSQTLGSDESAAATKIQAAFRGYEVRKRLSPAAEDKTQRGPSTPPGTPTGALSPDASSDKNHNIEHAMETAAATKIQANFRGYETRKHLRDGHFPAKHSSKIPVAEAHQLNSKLGSPVEEVAATKIQAMYRGYNVRKGRSQGHQESSLANVEKQSSSAQENSAATKIQANFRGYKTRKDMAAHQSNDVLTSTLPDNNSNFVRDVSETELIAGATKIQAGMRGYLARQELAKQKAAATKIQATFRGYKVRKGKAE